VTARARLPNRRASTTFTFEVGGLRYVATASSFDEGAARPVTTRPARLFVPTARRSPCASSCAFPQLRIAHCVTRDDVFDGGPVVPGYADDGIFWGCVGRLPGGTTRWRRIWLDTIQPDADKPAAELPPPHGRTP
jgi:hypothetical protein